MGEGNRFGSTRLVDLDGRTALAGDGGERSYAEVGRAADRLAGALLTEGGGGGGRGLDRERVALLAPPGFDFTAALLGIWCAGGIAVPLAAMHPPAEHAYVLDDAGVALVVADPEDLPRLAPLAAERSLPLLSIGDALAAEPADTEITASLPEPAPSDPALILYTSGTTGRPKGAVHTHGSLAAQIEAMIAAWGWRDDDRLLHLLPLHHTHGLVNCLLTPLAAGACCELGPARFDPAAVWRRLATGGITVLMAVPTIYAKLLDALDAAPADEAAAWAEGARRLRLAVSGSAALPAALFERWRAVAGEPPLERYGMTEIGMALSNPLDSNPLTGERRAGAVGAPMPGVEVRIVGDGGEPAPAGTPGELEVRGPQLFAGYWGRPGETAEAFASGGWFRTGDEAVAEDGVYRLLGRRSVDVLKVGGYKLSALEIEAALAEHLAVAECAVVGAPDPEYGQRVAAAVVPRDGADTLSLDELREWARDRLAPYKLPTRLLVLAELPRNPLGKVTKPALVERFGEVPSEPAPSRRAMPAAPEDRREEAMTAHEFHWPEDFQRIPDDDWTSQPLDRLALHYDSVEQHGWYRNLDPTVEAAAEHLADGAVCIDYSGGTGIFTDRLLRRAEGKSIGVVIVDSSPKFLRLALEKFRDHPRVAFRRIRWLADEHRLELLEEALDPELAERGAEVIVSTNAVHLYYDLAETVASWRRILRNGGRLLVQSGNIRNPDAPPGAWIIDETVGHIHRAAVELVGLDDRWARFRSFLEDEPHMAAHRALREKVFLPVRPLDHYVETIEDAGFEVLERTCRPIEARVEDWYDFLAVYHDAVLGWAGGAEKVTGRDPGPDVVALRRRLLRVAMDRVFDGADTFTACWTYLTAEPA